MRKHIAVVAFVSCFLAAGRASGQVEADYKEGIVIRAVDKKHELKIQSSIQLDTRQYAGDSVAPMSFDIRRARMDFNGRLFGDLLTIRIQAAMEDNPYIRNALLDIKAHDALHLRVGQMKVPFSSQWLTFDNQVDFMERGSAEPFYPFFDRGAMLWGSLLKGTVNYNLGVFTGAGVDLDATKGDIDDQKDVAWRLFLQPFRNAGVPAIEGLCLAGQGTWGYGTVPTRRFETRGMMAANYESLLWRWRTEQTLGSSERNRDVISGEMGKRMRFGAELHYIYGPFTLSGEWAMVRYEDLAIYHDFWQGQSKRLKHDLVMEKDGAMHNLSGFVSVFLTGEKKFLDNFGWRQPLPNRPIGPGGGVGSWELLARFSATLMDKGLFDSAKVAGFAAKDFTGTDGKSALAGPAPGEGASVTAAVLEGASRVYEVSGGLNWAMNYHMRVQLDYTYLWAPDFDPATGKGGIVSGGNSDLYDSLRKNRQVGSEHMVGCRFIFRM